MANAKETVVEIKKTTISLDLSIAEALTLRQILRYVGGCPESSARKFQEQIAAALDVVLWLEHRQLNSRLSDSLISDGGIRFKNDEELVDELEQLT